jgi:hypothetical protein
VPAGDDGVMNPRAYLALVLTVVSIVLIVGSTRLLCAALSYDWAPASASSSAPVVVELEPAR